MINTLLRFTRVRIIISYVRAFWFIKIRKRLTVTSIDSSKEVHEHTVFSNLRRVISNKENPHPKAKYLFGIDRQQDGSKIRLLMNPVLSIDHISLRIKDLKVLIIGPKLESEILSVISYGIPLRNITAIDLIKYSPWVDQGDMHDLPYEENEFDLILCGWVLAYSNNKIKAAKEMIRVAKSNAVIALSAAYSAISKQEIINKRGYLIGSEEEIKNSKFLLDLFGNNIKNIYFRHDIDEMNKKINGKIITVFSLV